MHFPFIPFFTLTFVKEPSQFSSFSLYNSKNLMDNHSSLKLFEGKVDFNCLL